MTDFNWGDGHKEPCANCGETAYERDGLTLFCKGCNAIRDEVYDGVIIDLKRRVAELEGKERL